MSPRKELRYIHSLVAMSLILAKVKMHVEGLEENNNILKELIVKENQIELFDTKDRD